MCWRAVSNAQSSLEVYILAAEEAAIDLGLYLGRIYCLPVSLVCPSVSGTLYVKNEITSVTTSPLRRLKSQNKGRSSDAVGVARKLLCVFPCHLTPTSNILITRPRINITEMYSVQFTGSKPEEKCDKCVHIPWLRVVGIVLVRLPVCSFS